LLTLTNLQAGQFNRDGRNGRAARPAVPGSPAGYLAVQVSESSVHADGGLHVDVVAVQPEGALPSSIEVPAGRDAFLSAIGGSGEDGLIGGDGEDGLDGFDGTDATSVSHATVSEHFIKKTIPLTCMLHYPLIQ